MASSAAVFKWVASPCLFGVNAAEATGDGVMIVAARKDVTQEGNDATNNSVALRAAQATPRERAVRSGRRGEGGMLRSAFVFFVVGSTTVV